MIMLKAATPAALQDYRDGIELQATRYPNRWGQIAEADHHCRWSQWDRMLEDGLNSHPPTRRQEDGWSSIIADSAFQYAYRGPLAAWWEKNVTWGLDHPTPGASQPSPPPVQLAIQNPQLAIQNGNANAGGARGEGQWRQGWPRSGPRCTARAGAHPRCVLQLPRSWTPLVGVYGASPQP